MNSTGRAGPRIFGDQRKYKAALDRQIGRGRELLDELEGLDRFIQSSKSTLLAEFYEEPWIQRVEGWRGSVVQAAHRRLADSFKRYLPVIATEWPSDTGKPRHTRTRHGVEAWLRKSLDELDGLRAQLGIRRGLTLGMSTDPFEELRGSGLVEHAVIDQCWRDMKDPRTPKACADAIDAAKELLEATLRSALDRLRQPWDRSDDLPKLMRLWRDQTKASSAPDPLGSETLDRALAQLANLVRFIGEWRNNYGRGHGKPSYPRALAPRHARLSADIASTAIRWVVSNLDDMEILPPPSPGPISAR